MNLSIAAKFGIFALTTVAVLASCDNGPTQVVDTTKPTITSPTADIASPVAPAAGSVSIVFSEAMKSTETIKAITVAPVLAGVTVSSADNKTFVIKPPASGWAPLTTYTVTVAVGAQDAAGNPLAAAKTFKFTTDKAGVVGTVKNATLTSDGNIAYDFPVVTPAAPAKYAFNATSVSKPGTFPVGNFNGAVSRGVLRFDLPVGVTAGNIKSAKLILNQDSVSGTPFTDLGGIQVKGVTFAADPGTNAKNEYLAGDGAGVDGIVNAGKISADVSAYMTGLTTTTADFVVRFKTEPADAGAGYKASTYVRFSSLEVADLTLKPVLEITLK
jgi:hypothetical protein